MLQTCCIHHPPPFCSQSRRSCRSGCGDSHGQPSSGSRQSPYGMAPVELHLMASCPPPSVWLVTAVPTPHFSLVGHASLHSCNPYSSSRDVSCPREAACCRGHQLASALALTEPAPSRQGAVEEEEDEGKERRVSANKQEQRHIPWQSPPMRHGATVGMVTLGGERARS